MTGLLSNNGNAWPNSLPGFSQKARPTDIEDENDEALPAIGAIFVDDDDIYREAVATELDYLGFRVSAFASGETMLASLTQLQADVIVLDWQLRTGLGIDLLPRINAMGVRLPVVFLTGMPAVAAEHAALDQGAVDFVDKARGTAILAKRLYRIVRSYRASPPPESEPALKNDPIRCGPLSLQPDVARAFWNGADIELTFSEFKIVHLLLARAGEYVTYRAIYDCVRYEGFMAGNGEDGFRTNVRSSIKRIRNKFRQFETDFDGIENYPAFGYRWRGLAAAAD